MSEAVPGLAYLIFLRSGIVVSKRPYADWRAIQDDYEDYKASLGPWTAAEIADYFAMDYSDDDARWPFSRRELSDFFGSGEHTLTSE